MKILLSWLQEFVSVPSDPRRLSEDLTSIGLAVDSISNQDGETVLELDITTNRPDCLSHYGVARELAAHYRSGLVSVSGEFEEQSRAPAPPVIRSRARRDALVKIEALDLCRRYSARLIREVTVGPSPSWLSRRLELVGVRSINNVADATNYLLMGYGHPQHAFDLDRLEGQRIIVRRANEGEKLTTLDGVERSLTPADLLIADARQAVALAGIMGGLASEISSQTRNVLLESAWFEPAAVRRTSKRQGLHTEASHRFERGADIGVTLELATRCAGLIAELAGGIIDPQVIDVYPHPAVRKTVELRRKELVRHLGLEVPEEEVEKILWHLGFSPRAKGRSGWTCVIPSYRVDMSREIDVIEEVARLYGYDKFPLRLPAAPAGQAARKAPHGDKEERVRTLLLGLGYDEAITSIMVSPATEAFGQLPPVRISNPLSEEAAALRTSLLPGLLSAVQWNLNRGQDTVRLFEVGKIYHHADGGFAEPPRLAMAATGQRIEPGVIISGVGQTPRLFDFFDLKGDLEQLLELFEVTHPALDREHLPDYYRPGHSAGMLIGDRLAARMGELNAHISERWKFRRPVYIAEVFLDVLYGPSARVMKAEPLSRFPAVERDFSIVLAEQTPFAAVREAIDAAGVAELMAIRPVEIFRGASIGSGKYSMLVRLTLQSMESTLTEPELAERSARIIASLEQKLGAQIRTARAAH